MAYRPTAYTLGGCHTCCADPLRVEHDLRLTGLLEPRTPTFSRIIGSAAFESEKLLAYELGYRLQPMPRLFLDVAAFYNRYTDLLSLEPGTPFTETTPPPQRLVVPFFIRNRLHGEGYGVELAVDWQPFDWWRVSGVYSYLQLNLHRDQGGMDTMTARLTEGASPQHQVSLRSFMTLPGQVEFDLVWRYVDHLPSQGIDSYITVDARLGWRPLPQLTVAVVGQNLLTDHHAEFGGGSSGTAELERSVYGKVVWHW